MIKVFLGGWDSMFVVMGMICDVFENWVYEWCG